MARLLFLSAFVVVLGSAMGYSVELKRQTESGFTKVKLEESDYKEIIDNIRTYTLTPKYFFGKCIGNSEYSKEQSLTEEELSGKYDSIAAEVNEQVEKYNAVLQKSTGDKLDMNYDEFEALENAINDAIYKLQELRTAATNWDQGEKVRIHCLHLYKNIMLIQAKGGLPATLQI